MDRPQLQAPRGVQASGTNRTSPCTHPSSKEGRGLERMGLFASVAMRPPGSPWFRHAGQSALHERDHRGGDHPIPFRTRQLSPSSPKVLRRQAVVGQGVLLAGDAFCLPGPRRGFAHRSAPGRRRGDSPRPGGPCPLLRQRSSPIAFAMAPMPLLGLFCFWGHSVCRRCFLGVSFSPYNVTWNIRA